MFGFFKKSGNRPMVGMGGSFSASAPQSADSGFSGSSLNASAFNNAITFVLAAVVLLVPLLFLPFTSEVRAFNKQAILFFAAVITLGIWVIKILTTRQVAWIKTPLDYVLGGYVLVYLAAALFSIDKASSFLGYYGRFTGSFLSVLSMIVLYYVVVNNVKSEKVSNKLVNVFSVSSGIVLVYSFLQLLGLYVLPFDFAKDRGFNPIGSLVGLAIFSALAVLFFQILLLTKNNLGKYKRIAYWILTAIGLIIMFLVNAFVAWLILALGMIAFLALGMVLMAGHRMDQTWFWKPMLVLVIAVLFVGFQFLPQSLNPRQIVNLNLPVEIQLSSGTTWNLVGNSLGGNAKQAIIGSGPGTTGLEFGNIKPQALNKTIVWSLNFDRASSEIANIIIETGLLGLLVFELTAILFFLYALFFLLRQTERQGQMTAFAFFIIWLTLYIAHFFYFFNTTFYFLYWFAIAVFMAIAHWKSGEEGAKNLSFDSSPRSALSWMFMSLLVLAVLLVGVFFQAAVYVAEASYASGLRELNRPEPNFTQVSNSFGRAITLNPYRDVYFLAYGQNLIFLASEEAAKSEPNIQNIQLWLADSVNAGLAATQISPAKASNWSALAQFYNGIRPLGVAGTDDAIIRNWQEAIKRDSKNPVLLVRLAQAYSLAADEIDPKIAGTGADADTDGLSDAKEQELGSDPNNPDSNDNGVSDGDEVKAGFNPAGAGRLTAAQLSSFTKVNQQKLTLAEEALRKAIELKDDLPDSRLELARVLEKAGKLADARKELDEAVQRFPSNPDVKFEQGRITFNQRNYTEAEKIFRDVVRLEPNHANAHYSLGLIYQQRQDNVKALAEFEKVREITGPNVELEKLINSLKAALTPGQ